MDRTMNIIVSISTDPRTAHIGRYFLDIRDTTRETQDPKGRQMATKVTGDPADFIRRATAEGLRKGVMVTFEDETGEAIAA